MKIQITDTKENPLLKRKEIRGIIEHDGMPTPSKASVQKFIAKENNVKENKIEIRKIFSAQGRDDAKLVAFIWTEKEVPILKEEKKEESPKEEPKTEEPAKKEESKAEAVKEEPKKEEPKKEDKKEEKKEEPKAEKPIKEEPKKEEKKKEKPAEVPKEEPKDEKK